MTSEHWLAIRKHIDQKWTQRDGGCPMCGGKTWEAHGYVIVTMSADPTADAPASPPQGFPASAVTCRGCGYVVLLNLLTAGVVK